jgi:hypothetical protein
MAIGIADFSQYQQTQLEQVEAYIDAEIVKAVRGWPKYSHKHGCVIAIDANVPVVGDFHYLAFTQELAPKYIAKGWSEVKWEDCLFKFIYKNPNEQC